MEAVGKDWGGGGQTAAFHLTILPWGDSSAPAWLGPQYFARGGVPFKCAEAFLDPELNSWWSMDDGGNGGDGNRPPHPSGDSNCPSFSPSSHRGVPPPRDSPPAAFWLGGGLWPWASKVSSPCAQGLPHMHTAPLQSTSQCCENAFRGSPVCPLPSGSPIWQLSLVLPPAPTQLLLPRTPAQAGTRTALALLERRVQGLRLEFVCRAALPSWLLESRSD